MSRFSALISDIFKHDVSQSGSAEACVAAFFDHQLSMPDLQKVHDYVQAQSLDIEGVGNVPAFLELVPREDENAPLPFLIQAQLHGNEGAGIAGILLAMVLADAGLITQPLWVGIGNHIAAKQYFEAYEKDPKAPVETRDMYRKGVRDCGEPIGDMNRFPENFREKTEDPYLLRLQQLDAVGDHISGILDIHTARGAMLLVVACTDKTLLKHSPIRAYSEGTLKAISGLTGALPFKKVLAQKENIQTMVGIEAGTHEHVRGPEWAAEFTLSLLHNMGLTTAPYHFQKEDGVFYEYQASPSLNFADLTKEDASADVSNDLFYTICPAGEGRLPSYAEGLMVIKNPDGTVAVVPEEGAENPLYAVCQFNELQEIKQGQVIAIGVPSGTQLKAPYDFHTMFVTK